jgi:hypothetical protein
MPWVDNIFASEFLHMRQPVPILFTIMHTVHVAIVVCMLAARNGSRHLLVFGIM